MRAISVTWGVLAGTIFCDDMIWVVRKRYKGLTVLTWKAGQKGMDG